ncbi:MAG TPA: hypothetical protein PKN87_04275 [Syntrophomonadaceae bacterium]|nr:hypothetical protein [Syntrophomonadaceae bacterium]HNX28612.1 hypothetical protein [Syntrophomonadaceae bacterium]HPR94010.1 hypothetical protein [Syntrophomonadaceae bacterium]
MKKLLDKIEKIIIRVIVLGIVVLVVVQGVMVHEPARLYLSWAERMEGQILEYPVAGNQEDAENEPAAVKSPQAVLKLTISQFSSLPRAKILINGQEQAAFDNREMEIPLMAGDIIEIDCTGYDFPVEFVIEATSENMAWPQQGKTYTANQSIVMIGKVIVK